MITATEARRLMNTAEQSYERELKVIFKAIEKRAKKGYDWLSFTYDKDTGSYICDNLEALGFTTIRTYSFCLTYTVQW